MLINPYETKEAGRVSNGKAHFGTHTGSESGAMTDGSTWRTHPFTAGSKYVALQTFAGYSDGLREAQFLTGHVYGFLCVGYSHYDGITMLKFQPEGDAVPIWWWWSDDESADEYLRKFRLFA